jgi:hypothetical protein
LDKGDLRAVRQVARRLEGRSDILPRSAITLAGVVGQEDLELARRLWRGAALAAELHDDAVGPAYATGVQLGLDQETAPLTERMARLAQERRGGVQALSIEELLAMGGEWNQAVEDALARYSRGAAPIHTVAATLRQPLSHLLHKVPESNEDDLVLLSQVGPRIRHGARTHPVTLAPGTRLRLDTTTLLVANHLDLLSPIEAAFAPIRLPHGISQLLFRMEEARTHHQPSRLEAYRELRRLLDAGRIRVTDTDVTGTDASGEAETGEARSAKRYRVVFASAREEEQESTEPGGMWLHPFPCRARRFISRTGLWNCWWVRRRSVRSVSDSTSAWMSPQRPDGGSRWRAPSAQAATSGGSRSCASG